MNEPKVTRVLALCIELMRLSKGFVLGILEPILLDKKATLESEYSAVCERVATGTLLLESASWDLDLQQADLAEVIKSEEDSSAQL